MYHKLKPTNKYKFNFFNKRGNYEKGIMSLIVPTSRNNFIFSNDNDFLYFELLFYKLLLFLRLIFNKF